ncbi:hypothetical protein BJV82DRAFT_589038 [Fennellomyces sp. T-0311]|nr:hypothetical protein BJV82DRAFT_589038 [Fennellomyces sp. T-0311]
MQQLCSKKRSHSEETAVEETSIKRKRKIVDSPTSLGYDSDTSSSPKLRSESCSPIQHSMTETQRKRAKRRELYASTMQLVKSEATIELVNCAPHATLKKHTRWTPYLTLPGFEQLPVYEQHAWRLCAVLFDESDPKKQALKLKQWLIQAVSSEVEAAILSIKKIEPDDPYAEIFTQLTFGRIADAASLATKAKDIQLALFIASPPSPKLADKYRRTITDKGTYYQKTWSVLSGKFDMLQNLDWKQLLLLYVMYGPTQPGNDPLDTLVGRYMAREEARHLGDASPWYSVIEWWWKRKYQSNQKTPTANIAAWPARLAWRFAVSFPSEISQAAMNDAVARWSRELQVVDLADWALMAALFSSRY